MRIGDYVAVNQGVKDPDLNTYDMSGWSGRITNVNAPDDKGERIIGINWDIDTLKKLPIKFIEDSIAKGYSFSEMYLSDNEISIISKTTDETKSEIEKIIYALESNYAYSGFDEQDKHIASIIEDTNLDVNKENLAKYRTYLLANLKEPIYLTGIEDFRWEEYYVIGPGSEKEYAQLKKTRPSYTDTFKLMKILNEEELENDLLAKVKRKTDRKVFTIPLSELKSIDEKTENYKLLDDFSVWVVNYQ